MIRATTGGVLKSYRSNLMNSFISVNKSRDTVLSQRLFNSYAEDPASAAKAFRLRKSRMTVDAQHDVCTDTYRKYQSAWSCLDTVSKVLDTNIDYETNTIKGATLEMLNDPTGDARTQLATALDQMSQTIVQTLNQKYGDNFIFAGADGHNVPFEVINNKLYYRGVDVDAAVPNVVKNGDAFIQVLPDGTYDEGTGVVNGGDTHFYLKSDHLSTISKADYQRNYVPPEIEYTTDHGPNGEPPLLAPFQVVAEYDADGNETKGGGYYHITNNRTDIGFDAPTGDRLISIDDYNRIVGNSLNSPQLLKNTAGDFASADANAVPTADGDYYIVVDGKIEDQVVSQTQYEKSQEDVKRLEYLMNEKQFVDIGLGFQEDEHNKLIETSGFDAALHGLTFIGYGLDEDGDPKNIYSIVQKLKGIADSVPDGTDWPKSTYDEFFDLVGKLEDAASEFKTEYTNMDASTTKLKNNEALLQDNFYTLQEQYADLEDVDMADAITSFIWAQYCYNAALKVGNSVLSESLMDYLS